jgi:hypothetical protein
MASPYQRSILVQLVQFVTKISTKNQTSEIAPLGVSGNEGLKLLIYMDLLGIWGMVGGEGFEPPTYSV